jgi:tRNA nucleotidyltransferase (CCA-adding enzyme)
MSENVSSKLTEYLPENILELVKSAGKKADDSGFRLFLVGGVVRDLLLGRPNFDLDLVVEGDAVKLAKELATKKSKLVVHERFGTATLTFDDFSLDFAMSRKETYEKPGALPRVQPGKIEDDLIRRDFSINAMAVYLSPERFGDLIDFYHGLDDLKAKKIRILHDNSFVDDATRMFRAVRYEQRMGFAIEDHTRQLMRESLDKLDTISGDRIRHELELMAAEEFPEKCMVRAGQLGLLEKVNKALKAGEWLVEKYGLARGMFKKSQLSQVYFSLLAYGMKVEQVDEFAARLNFPVKTAQVICQSVYIKAQLYRIEQEYFKPSDIYQLLSGYQLLPVEINAMAAESAVARKRLTLYCAELRFVKPELSGDDLLKLGVPQGPDIGDVLNILYVAKLNGDVKTRKEEVDIVRGLLTEPKKPD